MFQSHSHSILHFSTANTLEWPVTRAAPSLPYTYTHTYTHIHIHTDRMEGEPADIQKHACLWVDLFVCVSVVYNKQELLQDHVSLVVALPLASCLYQPVSCMHMPPWQDAYRLPPMQAGLVCGSTDKSVVVLCFSPSQSISVFHSLFFVTTCLHF